MLVHMKVMVVKHKMVGKGLKTLADMSQIPQKISTYRSRIRIR